MISAVLFDLDGTLVDSAPDLTAALNVLREEEGLAVIEVEELRSAVSQGGAGMVALGFSDMSAEQQERLKHRFLAHYSQRLYVDSHLFDGVDETLTWLESAGIPWGVVTNKHEQFALPVLQKSGLMARAGAVVCGDTLKQSKPHPAPVLLACELLGVTPSECVLLGDDRRDMEAAQAAGVKAAFAGWGYASVVPGGVELSFGSMPEFLPWIKALSAEKMQANRLPGDPDGY